LHYSGSQVPGRGVEELPARIVSGPSSHRLAGVLSKKEQRRNQMKQSMSDQIKGKLHEVKGEVKEKVGRVTKNPNLEAEGRDEKLAGKIQKKVGEIEKVLGE
jgi:uncharacterized protein YjbJ (UPF0337 family)